MPTQAAGLSLPWDELSDAFMRASEAERNGSDEECRLALEGLERAKDQMGALGNLLLLFALERCGSPVQKLLANAFDSLAQAAWKRATTAAKRATWAIEELDGLRVRVSELEESLLRLTLGVGEPTDIALVGQPLLTAGLRTNVSGGRHR